MKSQRVPDFFLRSVTQALQDEGVLRQAPPSAFLDIGWSELGNVLAELSCTQSRPLLGVQLGRRITEANLDVFGPVVTASCTLRECAEYCSELLRHVPGTMRWDLHEGPREARFLASGGDHHEQVQALIVSTGCHVARRFVPPERSLEIRPVFLPFVSFDEEALQDYFGCPIESNPRGFGLVHPTPLLDWRRPGTDASLSSLMRDVGLRRLSGAAPAASWAEKVRAALRSQPELTLVEADDLAQRWNLTGRMLRRRLAAEHAQLAGLVNEVRFERAKSLLASEGYSLVRIAEALGYSDVTAFQRAFKRWAGVSPAAFRTRTAEASASEG